jgi:ribonuclease Z
VLAAEAEVILLALTHQSPRHPASALRAEAREVFDRTIVPRDFDRVDLPLPEKGEPVHVRAREDGAAEPVDVLYEG